MNIATSAAIPTQPRRLALHRDDLLEQLDVALNLVHNLHTHPEYPDLLRSMLDSLPAMLDDVWPEGWPEGVKCCQRHLHGDLDKWRDPEAKGPVRGLARDCARLGLEGLVRHAKAAA